MLRSCSLFLDKAPPCYFPHLPPMLASFWVSLYRADPSLTFTPPMFLYLSRLFPVWPSLTLFTQVFLRLSIFWSFLYFVYLTLNTFHLSINVRKYLFARELSESFILRVSLFTSGPHPVPLSTYACNALFKEGPSLTFLPPPRIRSYTRGRGDVKLGRFAWPWMGRTSPPLPAFANWLAARSGCRVDCSGCSKDFGKFLWRLSWWY